MIAELTEHLLPHAGAMDDAWTDGAIKGLHGTRLDPGHRRRWADTRAAWGAPKRYAPILTSGPRGNVKLAKSKDRPAVGLQLMHHVSRVSPKLVVNACPNAGDCVAVCVARNGHNRWASSQRAQRTRTAFLAENPVAFSWLVGWELGRQVRLRGPIYFRPNVYSDVAWERLWPSMTSGDVLYDMISYGYTKRPEVLDTGGWLGAAYRVAYSWNETSDPDRVRAFLDNGGSVAIVTDRRKGEALRPFGPFMSYMVIDADLTDEWLFASGVIGDLTAKVRARSLIGRSDFVMKR